MPRAILIPANSAKEISLVEWARLEDLQQFVGGYIESAPFREDVAPYFNEEGKIMGLPRNERATQILDQADNTWGMPGDFIVGDCLFVGYAEDGEEIDVPEDFVKEVMG